MPEIKIGQVWSEKEQEIQYEKGWEDAVEGRCKRLDNPHYTRGYAVGLEDISLLAALAK